MKKIDVEEALRKVFDFYAERAPEMHRKKTPACLSLPRMREIALNQGSLKRDEKVHFAAGCSQCRKTLAMMEQELWHPNPVDLFLFQFGKYRGKEMELIRAHVQKDMCRRCLKIEAAARNVKTIRDSMRRAAEGAAEEARERLRGLAWGLSDILSAQSDLATSARTVRTRGTPKTAPPLPPLARQSEDGSLRCLLEENPAGFLELTVWTDSSRLAGAIVRFELFDAEMQKQGLSGYAVLAPRGETRQWEAVVKLPSITEALRQLGAEGWHVLVFAVHPDELTVEDEKPLRESILRITHEKAAVLKAWIQWMDDAMANAAVPEALKALIGELKETLSR